MRRVEKRPRATRRKRQRHIQSSKDNIRSAVTFPCQFFLGFFSGRCPERGRNLFSRRKEILLRAEIRLMILSDLFPQSIIFSFLPLFLRFFFPIFLWGSVRRLVSRSVNPLRVFLLRILQYTCKQSAANNLQSNLVNLSLQFHLRPFLQTHLCSSELV